MDVSVTIMAHKKRRKFVEQLKPQLDGAGAVWDRKNDRWDTGRRAMMAFDPTADWHLVVQDDAILCDSFLPGVKRALASVPLEHPVSFYTGRARPYAQTITKTVQDTLRQGKHWFEMRGPLWGVAVAVPVSIIKDMVAGADELDNVPNYDMRMAEYFEAQGVSCWYSVPSLVNHRVGDDNPSLVPGRGAHPGRQAHQFLEEGTPLDIDWGAGVYLSGDPSTWWTEEGTCTRCWQKHDSIAEAITHSFREHQIGPVDFLATTLYHANDLWAIYNELPSEARGKFYISDAQVSENVDFPHERIRRAKVLRVIGKSGPFTVVGAARDLRLIGDRSGWSLVGGEAN